jgi:hypothetical protein
MKRFLAAWLVVLWPSLAHSNSFGTDLSDLWLASGESGWGANIMHQGDILFITFFVYGPNNAPIWYSASDTRYSGSLANGAWVFTGALYQTNGPWLGGQFNPANVSYRQVGTVTVTVPDINSATLAYTVDNVSVQKTISRYAWRANNVAGSYVGATAGMYSSCTQASLNGYNEEPAYISVTHAGSAVTIQAVGQLSTCTYSGQYTQQGRLGAISGTYSCTNGAVGTYDAFEVEVNQQAFSARATARSQFCSFSGRVGGLRRGP